MSKLKTNPNLTTTSRAKCYACGGLPGPLQLNLLNLGLFWLGHCTIGLFSWRRSAYRSRGPFSCGGWGWRAARTSRGTRRTWTTSRRGATPDVAAARSVGRSVGGRSDTGTSWSFWPSPNVSRWACPCRETAWASLSLNPEDASSWSYQCLSYYGSRDLITPRELYWSVWTAFRRSLKSPGRQFYHVPKRLPTMSMDW